MKQFDKYRMVDGATPLAARYFNNVWKDIDLRLASLEEVKISWSAAVDEVVRFGLARIDELINEPLQAVLALSSQAESTSANLEQLRQLAEARTAALTALIETLQADTAAQVNAFIVAASGDITAHKNATAADLAAWKNQRTAEISAWMEDFEAAMQAARSEIDAQLDSLRRVRLERKAASFSPQPADTGKVFEVTATATVTLPAAATLGLGWCCTLRNTGAGLVTLQATAGGMVDGQNSYVMYPGEHRLVQCDGASIITVVQRPMLLECSTSFNFIKPPGYRAFDIDMRGGSGGGGGGGSGAKVAASSTYLSAAGGGGAGAGGARLTLRILAALMQNITAFMVGAAGVKGLGAPVTDIAAGERGTDGTNGGNTEATIDATLFSAAGGTGGKGGAKGLGGTSDGTGPGNAGTSAVPSIPNPARYGFLGHAAPVAGAGQRGVVGSGLTAPLAGGDGGQPATDSFAEGGGPGGRGSASVSGSNFTVKGDDGGDGKPGRVIVKGVV